LSFLRPDAGVTGRRLTPLAGFALLTAGALALLSSHRPDAFTHPQFWAEEGSVIFQDAYNDPRLVTLFAPVVGYLVVLPRLVAGIAAWMPLPVVPLLFTLVASVLQILPVLFVASDRMAHAGPRWLRILLGVIYLASPNFEVHANLTNAQWHLAVLAGLVLVASPPRSRAARVFDIAVLLLCGLTGPFAFLMLPIAVARVLIERDRGWWLGVLAVVTATLAVQLPVLLESGRLGVGRNAARWSGPGMVPLGAAPLKLLYLLPARVFIPALTGTEGNVHFNLYAGGRIVLAAVSCSLGVALVVVAAVAAPTWLRLFAAYCLLALAASLASPIGSTDLPQWDWLMSAPGGERYFLLPVVGFLALVAWAVSRIPWTAARWAIGGALLAGYSTGAIASWHFPVRTHHDLAASERALAEADPGSTVVVPINPDGWAMRLVKR
jgi:hypothetical protein